MKRGLLIFCAFALFFGFISKAEAKRNDMILGLGIVLGSPMGANMKYRMDEENALDFTVGLGFAGSRNFHFHMDYLYHWRVVEDKGLSMDLHLGIGPAIEIYRATVHFPSTHDETKIMFAARAPIGLDFMIKKVIHSTPIDFFIEFGPGLQVYNGIWYYFDGGIGFRYYFF